MLLLAPAAWMVPPWLLSAPAVTVVWPLAAICPPLLSSWVLAVMLLAPLPVWVMVPPRFDRLLLVICSWCAVVLAASSVTALAVSWSWPLLVISPRAPLTVGATIVNAPVPACWTLPSVLVRLSAVTLMVVPLVAIRPWVLFKLPGRFSVKSPLPV